MSDLPPEISAIVQKHTAGKKLNPEEVEKLKAWRESGNSARPEYADSMRAAASMLDISMTVLQAAKNAGCEGFRGSRVVLDEVEKFIEENDLSGNDSLSEKDKVELEKKREELRKIRFNNEVAEGRFINIDEQAAILRRIGNQTRQIIRTALEKRFPEVAEMKTQRQLRELGSNLYDEVCREMQTVFGEPVPEKEDQATK